MKKTASKRSFIASGAAGVLVSAFMAHAAMAQNLHGEIETEYSEQIPKVMSPELNPYKSWVTKAGEYGCCGAKDGLTGASVKMTGDPEYPMEITVTKTFGGLALSHPVSVKLTKAQYKEKEAAEIDRMCATEIRQDALAHKVSTCRQPPGAPFVFATEYMYHNKDDSYSFYDDPGHKYRMGDIVPADKYTLQLYCGYPAPRNQ